MSKNIKYYKLTVKDENHNGFIYKDGLNVDPIPFNKTDSCCEGGLYFSDSENIIKFIDDHRWIREISIPYEEIEFVKDPSNDPIKWRSHSVICGSRRDLNELSTWEWMVSEGIVMHDDALMYSAYNDHLELVKYLISLDNIKYSQYAYDYVLFNSAYYGCLDVVRYLVSLETVKFSHYEYDYVLRHSAYNGHLDIVAILKSFDKSRII